MVVVAIGRRGFRARRVLFVKKKKKTDRTIRIEFCVENEIKCNTVRGNVNKGLCGESATSKTRVHQRYKRFQDGRGHVEDDERAHQRPMKKRGKSERTGGYERWPNGDRRNRR